MEVLLHNDHFPSIRSLLSLFLLKNCSLRFYQGNCKNFHNFEKYL